MDLIIYLLVSIVGLLVTLLVLYFVVKSAVTEGMKEHTRWVTANRDEIEAKYAKPRT